MTEQNAASIYMKILLLFLVDQHIAGVFYRRRHKVSRGKTLIFFRSDRFHLTGFCLTIEKARYTFSHMRVELRPGPPLRVMCGPYLRARLMLNMLGFRSFFSFSRVCGLSLPTVLALLYDRAKCPVRIDSAARAYETLRSAFDEKQKTMDADEKRYVSAWFKKWSKELLETRAQLERVGQQVINRERAEQRIKRLRERKKRLKAILRWTPTHVEKTRKKKKKKCR